MESLLILAAVLFIGLPLPICIFLLVKRSTDATRIQVLESKLAQLSNKPSQPPPGKIPETVAPPPTPVSAATEPVEPPQPIETTSEPATPPIAALNAPAEYNSISQEPFAENVVSKPEPISPPPPPKPSGLTALLRSIGLWPPEEAASAEAGMMQWWLPRLGGLLATLSVISFAVYISQGTPPWVRFIELLIADIAVLGAGFFFINRRTKFGASLISTGLSMAYLTSIAAYAAPPVRIIHNPLIGILIQFAVIVGIFLISLRLANRNIAIMALVYGFLSSLFSAYVGLLEPSLISGLALYILGIGFSRKFNWLPILAISTIGAYLPVLSFCILKLVQSSTSTLPHTYSVIAALMISVSLLPFCEIRWNLAKSLKAYISLHTLNTTICLAVGYLYIRFFTNDLVTFYGIATLVFTVWATIFGYRKLNSVLFQLFFLKASALAALWFVNNFAGDIRWFALIIEAALVAWIALRSKSLLQELASLALWIVSLWLAFSSIDFGEQLEMGSFKWCLLLAQPLIAATVFASLKSGRDQDKRISWFYRIFAIINGFAGMRFIIASDLVGDAQPIATGIYGAILCAFCFIPLFANSIPAISGGLLIFIANVQYWGNPYNEASFATSAILAFLLAGTITRLHKPRASNSSLFAELLFHATWVISLYAFLSNAFQSEAWFAYLPALLSIGLLAVPTGPFKALRETSLVPLLLFAAMSSSSISTSWGNWIAVILFLGVLFLPNFKPKIIGDFRILRPLNLWRTIQHLLVAVILIRVAFEFESWLGRVLILLALTISFHLLWRIHKHLIALVLSLATLGLSLISVASIWADSLGGFLNTLPWAREALTGGLLTTAIALGIGIDHARTQHRKLSAQARNGLAYLAATIAFATIIITLSSDLLWRESSFTPLVALSCLILIAIGIGAKIKPYRMVALIGFALPLARLFIYDIRETLTRIIAFAILSVLITFIGYLYHRFQSRIE
ncbi:MAG: hypothetical protein HOA81_03020 [Opitutales bacterium]|nr:hypothetical protein [Opitutales bacterium]